MRGAAACSRVARHHFADRDGTYSFNRLDAEVVQHIPILRENWVISLRGRLETTPDDDDQVPYFLLPSLGSGSTLRGYSSWRFRDRHAVLIVGRVAVDSRTGWRSTWRCSTTPAWWRRAWTPSRSAGFVSDYGVGVRFHGPARTPLRVELARGREGTRLVFAASAAF